MNEKQVINLGETRSLLAEWNEVRVSILAGQVSGFLAGVRTRNGEETVHLAGVYRDDPMEALRSMFRAAAACTERPTQEVTEAPAFRASRM